MNSSKKKSYIYDFRPSIQLISIMFAVWIHVSENINKLLNKDVCTGMLRSVVW
jgi:hypothetical protein